MPKKLTVKKLVEFNRLSDRRRTTFLTQLDAPSVPKPGDTGGDYWIRSLSGLASAFKNNDNGIIQERIDALSKDFQTAKYDQTKKMYQRNLDILINYNGFDFSVLRPDENIAFVTKSKELLNINNVSLQVLPHHVFTYKKNDERFIGAVWFVAWLDKFQLSDLGIFSESMFRYLTLVYSKNFTVDSKYCITVDGLSMETVSYEQVKSGEIPSTLERSINNVSSFIS